MDNSPAIAWVKDEQGRHVYLNKTFETRFGVRLDDWRGKTDHELWPPDLAEQFRSSDLAVLASRGATHSVEQMIEREGRRSSWLTTKFSFQDPAGNRFVAGMATDVTQREQAEQALREANARLHKSEELLRSVTDNSPDAIYVKDLDSRWLMANAAVLRIVGKTAEQVSGKTDLELYADPEIGQAILDNDRSVLERGDARAFEELADTPEGRRVFLSIKAPRRDAEGTIIGLVGISRDITERKRIEEALRQSEQKYRYLAETVQDVIWIMDTDDLRFLYVSPSVLKQRGYTPEEVIAAPVQAALTSESAERVARLIAERRAELIRAERDDGEGRFYTDEVEQPCKDGSVIGVEMVTRLYRSQTTGHIEGLGVSRDITGRKRAEEELRESEERFRLFMDNSPTIAWIKDEQGRYVYLSKPYVDRFGVRPEDWQGKTDAELRPAEVAEVFRKNDLKALAAGHPIEVTEETVNEDGSRSYSLNSKFPFRDATGNRFVGGIGLDITARKRMEEALREANARLVEADRRKDEFLATLSHELRNPLAPIRYALPLIQQARLDGAAGQAVAVLTRQVDQLARLLDDLLDMARITTGRIELRRDRVTVASVVDRAVESVSPAILRAEHQLHVTVPDHSIWIEADAARVVQVVSNLLDNAAKYTPRGGEIWLEAASEDRAGGDPRARQRPRHPGGEPGRPLHDVPAAARAGCSGRPGYRPGARETARRDARGVH